MMTPAYAPEGFGRTPDELAENMVDRLNKSLRLAGMSINEMAAYIEVHRNTVAAWLAGRNTPSPATLRQWAMRTNVPYEWLRHGAASKDEEPKKSRSKK